jgi:arginyl-tRNA--protein-N-Asp/Glu arginylyltransferase
VSGSGGGKNVTEQNKRFPEFYVTAPQPCPYLSGRLERKIFTHLTPDKPEYVIDNLLKGGFRRSQNIAYMPYCDNCSACVSVRIGVDDFAPRRTMKRILSRNEDLVARRVPSIPTKEQYSLFRSYINARHADGGMADMSALDFTMMVEDSVIDTFLTEYRLRPEGPSVADDPASRRLAATALCDRLSDGVSLVYSFYDPALKSRSLGSYVILEHIEYARRIGLPYVYLGYWIAGSHKMRYKSRFMPQERLTPQGWVRMDRER